MIGYTDQELISSENKMSTESIEERLEAYLKDNPIYVWGRQERALKSAGFDIQPAVNPFSSYLKTSHVKGVLVSPSWCVGGLTGGSCYGDNADRPVEAEEKPAWLENLMERVFPEVSFLKFRRIQKACVTFSYSDPEYYGNYRDMACEVLRVSDLLDILQS